MSLEDEVGRIPAQASQGSQVSDADQRASERSGIELRVEYQRMNTFFYDYTKNISRGGTFVRTDRPLHVGTSFVFKLQVPNLVEPLQLTGEVRWIRRPGEPGGGEPGMGIQFIFADDNERAAVDQVVERLMVESLGRLIYSRLKDLRG
jgi:type IV pilus assembly protein PilZ